MAAWKTRPSWFIVSERDLMIPPALQKASAKRISARTVSLSADHVPMLSKPWEVAETIVAAQAAGGGPRGEL